MTQHTPSSPDRLEVGKSIRSAVLGAEHVARSMNQSEPFMAPMQALVTEWCWGEVWARPGLERRTRSMLNLAMLTALNRPHEVELHVKGALNNGVTPEEIQEVLLQAAVYCGVPAALDSFRIANAAIKAVNQATEYSETERGTK